MAYTVTENSIINVKTDVLERLHNNDKESIINLDTPKKCNEIASNNNCYLWWQKR